MQNLLNLDLLNLVGWPIRTKHWMYVVESASYPQEQSFWAQTVFTLQCPNNST